MLPTGRHHAIQIVQFKQQTQTQTGLRDYSPSPENETRINAMRMFCAD